MDNMIIDRETYRTIKKMSREELQAFLMRYAEGLSKDTCTVDLQELEKDVKGIKGIGEKRAEEVMKVIEIHLGVYSDKYQITPCIFSHFMLYYK